MSTEMRWAQLLLARIGDDINSLVGHLPPSVEKEAERLCKLECRALLCETGDRCIGGGQWGGPGASWFETMYVRQAILNCATPSPSGGRDNG